jgi:hypothetical protein
MFISAAFFVRAALPRAALCGRLTPKQEAR